MSEYNIKAARDSFIKTGAYLARDLGYLDEITDARVYRWRTGAMSLVRIGKQMFSECENRDKRIAELKNLLRYRDGGTHDADCKIHYDTGRCTCGHDAVNKALGEADDG